MNATQQQDLFAMLIEKYIQTEMNGMNSIASLKGLKEFPIHTSPHFPRIIQECCRRGNKDVLMFITENYPDFIDQPNVQGQTPLFIATENNRLDLANYLIENGAKVIQIIPTGDTYLHCIAKVTPSSKKLELITRVWSMYPEMVKSVNILLETPLHLAALSGDLEAVKLLIEYGGRPTDRTSQMVDVYGYALSSGNRHLTSYLKPLCRKENIRKDERVGFKELKSDSQVERNGSPEVKKTCSCKSSALAQDTSSIKSGSDTISEKDDEDCCDVEVMKSLKTTECTIDGLYTKFQNYKVEKESKVRQFFKKNKMSKDGFIQTSAALIKEAFLSRSMLENPNDFGKGKKYRVISLDGGGIKVLMELIILKRLSAEFPDMFTKCNLFCGVSASSAVITCLTLGYSLDGLIAVIENVIRYSFKKDSIQSVTNAKYINDYLKAFGETAFGSLTLKCLPRHVVIPAFLIDSGKEPRVCRADVFTNIVPGNETEKVADVCLRSAAAPSYYKPYQNYVDGGVIDNIPCGLAWPLLIGEKGIGIHMEDIVCLSLSAGRITPAYIDVEKIGNGGMVQWATQLVDLFMLSRRDETVKEAKTLFGNRFLRVDPILPGSILLDNVDQIDEVKRIAEGYDLDDIRFVVLD
ncbi:ankyrin repeat-containing protein, putative [Entamoeba invadens IP1]|uniref:phospholipase A2 n=1 Tax=Entamoeba invadens IP1 TaxID=370355 RepID=A0A0A1U9U9_ENTIV|nr:ankyrin repeat-containing protein, putative [Entamoeba invadens IP1]ELP91838.1 ankyrin repeat-containing protein, putative [Entamoeba invadens IP1]|eukprot:XP_004258609.1 ankyrin repeat-containing protein, putative [Entamoeba invadens IP1]